MPLEDRSQDWETAQKDIVEYKLPTYLPPNIKLRAFSPTLISLIHLSGEEIESLKDTIGSDSSLEPIHTYNWPTNTEPGSHGSLAYFPPSQTRVPGSLRSSFCLFR